MSNEILAGCSFHKPSGRWISRIKIQKTVNLGYFETEKLAAVAYDYALEYFGRPKVNFPDEQAPDAIVRKVRPKLVEIRKRQLLEAESWSIDDSVYMAGMTAGSFWAQSDQKEPINLEEKKVDMLDPESIISALGVAIGEFHSMMDFGSRPTKAKTLVWLRGFITGARGIWRMPKVSQADADAHHARMGITQAELRAEILMKKLQASSGKAIAAESDLLAAKSPDSAKTNPVADSLKEWETDEYKQKIIEVAKKQKLREQNMGSYNPDLIQEEFTTDGEFIFGMPHQDGSIFSPKCNPRTLARDNAAIRNDAINRTGFFQMLDEDNAKYEAMRREKEAEIDLSAIL